jgi:hypothetical protein
MKSHRRIIRRLRALALALVTCTALAAPAAAEPGADYPQPSTAKIGDTPADFGKTVVPPPPPPPPLSEASDTGGFDWPSAAIGAGGAGVVIVVSLGGMSLASRRRIRVAR